MLMEETVNLQSQEQTVTTMQIGNYPVMEIALEVMNMFDKKDKVILKSKDKSIPNAVAVANIITEKMLKGNIRVQKITLDTVDAAGIGRMISTIEIILAKTQ